MCSASLSNKHMWRVSPFSHSNNYFSHLVTRGWSSKIKWNLQSVSKAACLFDIQTITLFVSLKSHISFQKSPKPYHTNINGVCFTTEDYNNSLHTPQHPAVANSNQITDHYIRFRGSTVTMKTFLVKSLSSSTDGL